jgi:hypothetical protein
MHQLIGVLLFGGILFFASTADAACAAPPFCQVQTAVGQSAASTQVSMPNVGAGHAIVVSVRNGQAAPQSSISNSSLTWTLVAGHQNGIVGWRHDVHCAIAPSAGTQNFTVNTDGGNVGIRVIAVEYAGISCTGTRFSAAEGTSATPDSGTIKTTAPALIFESNANDTDLQGYVAGPGFTIRNSSCNHNPLCVADKGIQPGGTYSGTWTINADTWDAIVVSFPQADVATQSK